MTEQGLNKRVNRIKWLSMVVVALAFFFVQFHRNTPGVMRDELTAAFQMSSTSFGLFSSMYFYPYMIAQIPVGMLLDTLGVRKTIGISSLIAAIGAFVFGMADVYPVACVGRVLIGIGVAAPVISTQKFLVSWVGAGKSASYYGVFSFMGKLGGMVAQLPLAWLVSQFDWRTVFFICAGISVVIALLCAFVAKDSPEEALRDGRKAENKEHVGFFSLLRAMGRVLANRYIWLMMVVMFLHQGLYGLFSSTWAVPYLQDVFGLSTVEASSYTTCMLIGAMVFAMAAGVVSDQLKSRKAVIAFVSAVFIVEWLLLSFCGEMLMRTHLLWVVMFLMGAGGCSVQIMFAYSREMNDPRYVGISVSVINMVGMLGSAVFPTIFGAMLDGWSGTYAGAELYRMAFIPCIILSVVSLAASLLAKETGCHNRYHELVRKNSDA